MQRHGFSCWTHGLPCTRSIHMPGNCCYLLYGTPHHHPPPAASLCGSQREESGEAPVSSRSRCLLHLSVCPFRRTGPLRLGWPGQAHRLLIMMVIAWRPWPAVRLELKLKPPSRRPNRAARSAQPETQDTLY